MSDDQAAFNGDGSGERRRIAHQFMFGVRFGLGLIVAQLIFFFIAGTVTFLVVRAAVSNATDQLAGGSSAVVAEPFPSDVPPDVGDFGELGIPPECEAYLGPLPGGE